MHKDDEAWVRQVLAGDPSTYEKLVEAHKGRVFAQVVGRIGNFSAAEDVVQNAFVEAYVHLKSLKSPDKFAGWLRGISVNLSNKWLQHQRPSVPIETVEDEVSEKAVIALPDEVFEVGQTKEAVLEAVEGLPDIYREVVLLHYMEGMTYPEMAALLDVPESTVTGRLQVARNRLRDDLMPLVEETLQEKRPTSHLTRKIMSALPLAFYAAPTGATLLTKMKGSAMIKMMGFLTAGVIGTGVYFGGIQELIGWRAEDAVGEEVLLEFVETEAGLDQTVLGVAGKAGGSPPVSGGSGAKEKAPGYIRIQGKAEDRVVSFTYTVPESSHVELRVLDEFDVVALPVFEPQKAGRYTVDFDKKNLPVGLYKAQLLFDHKRAQDLMYYAFYNNPSGEPLLPTIDSNGDTSETVFNKYLRQTQKQESAFVETIQDSNSDSLMVHSRIDSLLAVYNHSAVHQRIAHTIYRNERFLSTGVYHAKQELQKYQDRLPQERAAGRFLALESLGQLQFKQNKYREAESALGQALEVFQEMPAYHDLVRNRWDRPVQETLNKMAEQQGLNTVQEKALLAPVDSVTTKKSGEGAKVERAHFKMKTSPQDSLVAFTYSIPKSIVPDSAMVEINIYNLPGQLIAKPVRSVLPAGNYTAYQNKRELPDGRYFIVIVANGEPGTKRMLKLVWEDRK